MSSDAYAAAPTLLQNATTRSTPHDDVKRRLADYHPTVWGDYFLKYASDSSVVSSWAEQFLELKETVGTRLATESTDHKQKLKLIDDIQRLGVAFHFEAEIDQLLQNIYSTYQLDCQICDDFSTISLEFRLLRQQGYNVSSDVFNKLKDAKGGFKEEVVQDVQGLLSLYEASHLSTHGEGVLDATLAFTSARLESMVPQLSPSIADQVTRALKRPLRKGLTRLEAQYYIPVYQQQEGHSEPLLNFAKLDFNILQKLQQEETSVITKWWKELDFARKLPYARDRVVECYFWPLGVFFEPQFSFGRKLLTKAIAVLSVIDDTYDAYGTLEELELFTKVIQRFETNVDDELPDYLRICYQALLDLVDEIHQEMAKQGKSYCSYYAKEGIKELCRAYMVEARWFHENYVPTMEEYIKNGLVTSVYPLLITISFIGMGDILSREALEWIFNRPNKMVDAASLICRVMDDIVSHKFEQNRGHVASAVECYMKQHGVTEEGAYEELNKLVSNAWKDMNEELLKPTSAGTPLMPLLTRIHNFARVIDVVYKDEDAYTHSKISLKHILSTLLVHPI